MTPVDLQSYTSWKQETGERVAAAGGSRHGVLATRGARPPAHRLPQVGSRDAGRFAAPGPSSSRFRRSTCRRSCAGRAKADVA